MNISCILWPFHGSVARCTFFPFPYPLINDSTVIHSPWCLSLSSLYYGEAVGLAVTGMKHLLLLYFSLFSIFNCYEGSPSRPYTFGINTGEKKIIDYFVLKSEKTNNLQRNQNIGVLRGEFKGSKVCTKIVTEIPSLRFFQICSAYYIY